MCEPLLSIIVVAYNIENYIEQCLLSCKFAELKNYEVIVVENHSTDRTAALAAAICLEQPDLFKLIQNNSNEGLGEARNIGLRAARGRYVAFLDGDDWYSEQAGPAFSELLSQSNFDVCIFNHARTYSDGRVQINNRSDLLTHGFKNTAEERTLVSQNLGTAWNKLLARNFLLKHELYFPRGFYEDIAWNFRVLFSARQLLTMPDVLINYRQRPSSILHSRDSRHVDAFLRYQELVEWLGAKKRRALLYSDAVYKYARGQLAMVVAHKRLPKKMVPQFMRQATVCLMQLRSLGKLPARGLREYAFASGSPRLLALARKVEKFLMRLFGSSSPVEGKKAILLAKQIRRRAFSLYYKKVLLKRPVDEKLVMLESYWGKKIDCNPLALARALREAGYKCVWCLRRPPVDSDVGFDYVVRNSMDYWRVAAKAKYFISNANLDARFVKRRGQVHVQTMHGTPLKSMGLDEMRVRPDGTNWRKMFRKSARWDYVLSSNSYSSRIWRRAYPFEYKVLESGYPRNDILFGSDGDLADIRKKIGLPKDVKVALFAPTFREVQNSADGKRGMSPVLNTEEVLNAMGDEYVLLTRAHYYSNFEMVEDNPRIIDVSAFPNGNELVRVVDLLITDYSSIMFDYACLKRPIILYCSDYEQYKSSRGMYFDIRQFPPGEIVETEAALLECLRERRFESAENMERLTKFNARFCAFDDGKASQRVLHAVFGISSAATA
jgi:CDP-glycerol glycerophosphotransferase